jgi:hypothetical protein
LSYCEAFINKLNKVLYFIYEDIILSDPKFIEQVKLGELKMSDLYDRFIEI